MALIITMIPINFSYAKDGGNKKQRRTSINFEAELIHGEAKTTSLFHFFRRKKSHFKRMINLRKNFLPEMRRDAENLSRGGNKD